MITLNYKPNEFVKRILLSMFSALIVFCVASGSIHAQQGNDNGEPQVTLNLQDVDIAVLISTVAEVSGKNFIVDPRVRGKVSVISGAPLNPDELYDVFLSILEVHNFATVDSGSVIKVLPSNVIKQRPIPTLFESTQESNDTQITQIIQLEHASVQDLVAIVRPLLPPTSHFAPHVPSNSVIITDTGANIQRVLEIIKRIDVPDKSSNVRVIYLQKSQASELAGTLTQILANRAPGDTGAGPNISIQPVDSINALIVSSTDEDFAKVQALIYELDVERELQGDINVIYLKHARAEDLVTILNDVTAGQGEGGITEFSVQADEATNSLIVKASSNQLKVVQGVIDKLDVQRAQVYVETVIAEVSLDQAADLGITFGAGGGNTIGGGTDAAGNTIAPTTVGNLVDDDNPGVPIRTAAIGTAFDLATGGLNFSLLDFDRFQLDVIVNAIRADTNSNILSTPTILTLDNEEAEIIVGQEVPFITGSFNNGINNSTTTDADGNNISNSFGNSFQTIERRDVGIMLRITPQISEGDTIQLEIFQEISSVEETAVQGQADLITNRRSLEAVVQADDGQVVVLGGLIEESVTEVVSYVPFLGKLPVVGALFRNKSEDSVKRNLMVFLKPRIIRTADDLSKYSKVRYDEIRRDGQLSRLESSEFLIKGFEPPVLDVYENVIDDGVLQSEHRRELIEKYRLEGVPENKIEELLRLFNKKPTEEAVGGEVRIGTPSQDRSGRNVIDLYRNDSTINSGSSGAINQ